MKITIRYPKPVPQPPEPEHVPAIKELAEKDRATCATFAYPVGTVCLYHMRIPDYMYCYVPKMINRNNRLCIVLEIIIPPTDFATEQKLDKGCLDVDKIRYKVEFIQQLPFFTDTPIVEVEHDELITEAELKPGISVVGSIKKEQVYEHAVPYYDPGPRQVTYGPSGCGF